LNKKWIKVLNEELYNFAVWVAESSPQVKDQAIDSIRVFLEKNLADVIHFQK